MPDPLPPGQILDTSLPVLPSTRRALAERAVWAWRDLPPNPHGITTCGFFDGHGWNMAFDAARNRLNGVYDFADSGFGASPSGVHLFELAWELTKRIVAEYEALTGRALECERIVLLTGVHRLSELAELANDPAHVAAMVRHVEDWAEMR